MNMYCMPLCFCVSPTENLEGEGLGVAGPLLCCARREEERARRGEEGQALLALEKRERERETNLHSLRTIILPTNHALDVVAGGGWVDTFML